MDLGHAATRVVGVTGALLHWLLGQARVQVHDFSCGGGDIYIFSISPTTTALVPHGPKPQLLLEARFRTNTVKASLSSLCSEVGFSFYGYKKSL